MFLDMDSDSSHHNEIGSALISRLIVLRFAVILLCYNYNLKMAKVTVNLNSSIIVVLTYELGFAVNGQAAFTVSEENSSPHHIIAKKGSSVWLHWNYTYIGDGMHLGGGLVTTYREQTILVNSTSQSIGRTLAKRIGQNGALTLESPVPSPFNGRVEMISSNSTLVIHGLQYNDSTYQFSSYVTLEIEYGAGTKTNKIDLKPIVSITVNGMITVIML